MNHPSLWIFFFLWCYLACEQLDAWTLQKCDKWRVHICVNFVCTVLLFYFGCRLRINVWVRKLNICNALIKSSLLYSSETWRLTENNKRRVEAAEMDALRRSCRISRKERIRNVTIRQQIGLEETILKKLNRTSLHGTAMFKEWQKEDNPK